MIAVFIAPSQYAIDGHVGRWQTWPVGKWCYGGCCLIGIYQQMPDTLTAADILFKSEFNRSLHLVCFVTAIQHQHYYEILDSFGFPLYAAENGK